MADRTVSVALQANVRGFVSGVQRARAETARLGKDMLEHAGKNEQAWNDTGKALMGVGLAAGAATALAVTSFARFDQQMSAVQAATLASADEMDGLREAAIAAGQETAFSAQEAGQGIEELAKAGVSTTDIIGGGLAGALSLAAAGNLDVATAAEIAATAVTQFGLSGDEVTTVADALAAGANKAQGSVQDLGLALSYAGVPANALGLSVEETTGVLGLFANAGIIGEKAGTAFRSMLVSLQNPSSKAATLMEELGVEVFDAEGNFIGMEATAGVLQERLGGLDQQTRGAALATIFGNEALGAATTLYEGGAEAVATWTANVSESGYAAEVASTRMDNLMGDVEELGGSLETALIGLGESGDGPLRELTQDLTTMVNLFSDLPPGAQSTALAVGGVTAAVGLAAGATLLLVPRLQQTYASLQMMGPAGLKAAAGLRAVGASAGPIGLALTGITVVGGILLENWIDQKQAVDNYAGSLDELSGSVTDATRAVAAKTLEDQGALEAAERLGISTSDLVTAIVEGGDAYDAVAGKLSAVSEENRALNEAQQATSGLTNQTSQDVYALEQALGSESEALAKSQEQTRRKAEATREAGGAASKAAIEHAELAGRVGESGTAADTARQPVDLFADAVGEVGEEAATAEEQIDALDKALDALLGAELGVQEATDATENAIASLTERTIEANGNVVALSGGLVGNTQAARDNRAAINDAMRAVQDEAIARAEAGEGIGTITGRIYESRDALIAEAIERGASREEAEAYTEVLLAIPGTVTSTVTTPGMDQARRNAEYLKASIDAIPRTVRISIESYESTVKQDIAAANRGGTQPFTGKAAGGIVRGPGSGTSDSIPTMLSNGEYVIRASSVSKVGKAYLDSLNAGIGFASGGYVSTAPAIAPSTSTYGGAAASSAGVGSSGRPVILMLNDREVARGIMPALHDEEARVRLVTGGRSRG